MPAYKLPLTLTVKAVRSGGQLEVDAVVADAEGTSVSYVPLVIGGQTPAAGVCAILQNHVDGLARVMFQRGEAVLAETEQTDEEKSAALDALVGCEFTGSVVG